MRHKNIIAVDRKVIEKNCHTGEVLLEAWPPLVGWILSKVLREPYLRMVVVVVDFIGGQRTPMVLEDRCGGDGAALVPLSTWFDTRQNPVYHFNSYFTHDERIAYRNKVYDYFRSGESVAACDHYAREVPVPHDGRYIGALVEVLHKEVSFAKVGGVPSVTQNDISI